MLVMMHSCPTKKRRPLKAQGYDRRSSSHYSLTVTDQVVQLHDHAAES
jgi:hypothetical protein